MSLIVSVPVWPASSGNVFRKLILIVGTSATQTDAAAPNSKVAGSVVVVDDVLDGTVDEVDVLLVEDAGTVELVVVVEEVVVDGVVEVLGVVVVDDEVVVVGGEEVVVVTTVVGGRVVDVVTSLVVEEVVVVDPIVDVVVGEVVEVVVDGAVVVDVDVVVVPVCGTQNDTSGSGWPISGAMTTERPWASTNSSPTWTPSPSGSGMAFSETLIGF